MQKRTTFQSSKVMAKALAEVMVMALVKVKQPISHQKYLQDKM